MSIVTLCTGGNIGDVVATLERANRLIEERIGVILKKSSIHSSQAWGFTGDDFLNQVVVVETQLTPHQLLDATQLIEHELGRENKSHNGVYESRTIDIDILYYDNLVFNDERLTIPHPLIEQREFVLTPLKEITVN